MENVITLRRRRRHNIAVAAASQAAATEPFEALAVAYCGKVLEVERLKDRIAVLEEEKRRALDLAGDQLQTAGRLHAENSELASIAVEQMLGAD
jgi:hypothetical protein